MLLEPENFSTLKPDDAESVQIDPATMQLRENNFKLFRIFLIVAICLLRLSTFKIYMQELLFTPKKELDEQRKEIGFMKAKTIQDEIKKINISTCITALQYVIPTLILGFMGLFLLGCSDLSFVPSFKGDSGVLGQLIALENRSGSENLWVKMMNKYSLRLVLGGRQTNFGHRLWFRARPSLGFFQLFKAPFFLRS